MAVTITDEMRRAVHEEDCRQLGHILSTDRALRLDGRAGHVAGPDGQQPHITCVRCQKVWLVIEEPADDYDTATQQLDARLLPEHRRPRPART